MRIAGRGPSSGLRRHCAGPEQIGSATAVGAAAVHAEEIEDALIRADADLGRVIRVVIARVGRQRIAPSRAAPFEALVRAIVYQSVSGKAAAAIFTRLKEAAGGTFTPAKILAKPQGSLMSAGLSKSKAHAIRSLAEWFTANRKTAKALPALPDDDVIAALTGIAGIGAWTVNVFLIFNLGRLDVMPAGDLGIRRGVQLVCGLEDVATPKQVRERAQLWRPYRSIASIYLWTAVKLKVGPGDLE
jgi:3-methyladenine DNA glycosylase/8-oxoguanine DNA glycosylase